MSCANRTDFWVVCLLRGRLGPVHCPSSAHVVHAVRVAARERLELFLGGSMAILSQGVTNKLIAMWGMGHF